MVPMRRLELPQGYPYYHLKVARLPIPPQRHMLYKQRCDTIQAMKKQVQIRYLGPETAYPDATQAQENAVAALIAHTGPEVLFFAEHSSLYTSGTSADQADRLPLFPEIPTFETGRGGQLTYHGPGQRVLYPILDLGERGKDLRVYIRNLQSWVINTLDRFDIKGYIRDEVGVWVDTHTGPQKIAAIGVRVRQWVTFHGIALNVNPNLDHFKGIIPCGISQFGVTSMAALLHEINPAEVDRVLCEEFTKTFNCSLT